VLTTIVFCFSLKEEIVGELSRAEGDAFGLLETMTKYYISRAKLVSKVSDNLLVVNESSH
jgi:hypothetical protein